MLRCAITGGASGIGRVIAQALTARGDHVYVADADEDAARTMDGELHAIVVDVSDPAGVARFFTEVDAKLGGLDVLVNNAGMAGPTAPVDEIDPEAWERTIAVNLTGHFLCARSAVPLLKAAGGGSIVNIASTAGILGYPNRTPYAASKWGVVGLTKTLAMELGQFQIRVNAICPGPVAGPRMDAVIEAEAETTGTDAGTIRASYSSQTSLGTFVEAADIAAAVLFLTSPAARRISGQVLGVDGHTETLRI